VELVVTRADGDEVLRRPLSLPCAVIGRNEDADVPLQDALVSRRHVYMQLVAGRLFCVDLGSRTGTHWRHGTQPWGWLDRGEAIRVGPFFVRAEGEVPTEGQAGPDPDPLSAAPTGEWPRFSLEFLHGDSRPKPWRVSRVLTLFGHARVCRVRLVDPSVSGVDCGLLHTPQGLWAIDLLGSGGLVVNDKAVRWAPLAAADVVRIGEFSFRVRADVASPPTPAWEPPPRLDEGVGGTPTAEARVARGQLVPQDVPHPLLALPPGTGEAQRALLMPLVNQFAQMQQQMFDQFQQTILMLVEMFTALHKDQMNAVRRELDDLRALTRELHELQQELAGWPAPAAPAPAPAADEPHEVAESPATAAPTPESNGAGPARPSGGAEPASVQPRPAEQAAVASTATGPLPSERPDIHLRIQQRIASIQRERQTRLQKILHFVMGE
jgi:hypothetical protein